MAARVHVEDDARAHLRVPRDRARFDEQGQPAGVAVLLLAARGGDVAEHDESLERVEPRLADVECQVVLVVRARPAQVPVPLVRERQPRAEGAVLLRARRAVEQEGRVHLRAGREVGALDGHLIFVPAPHVVPRARLRARCHRPRGRLLLLRSREQLRGVGREIVERGADRVVDVVIIEQREGADGQRQAQRTPHDHRRATAPAPSGRRRSRCPN